MNRATAMFSALYRDDRGAMMIETAIVAPVLVLMSLGAFQVSQVIARQTELQGAMAEASAIAMTALPATSAQRTALKGVIVTSTELDAAQVVVTEAYRCGSATTYVTSADQCVGTKVANYVKIELNDTYTPTWTEWGIGSPIQFNVDRYVMIKQT
jgi:Flp pilus assembly protein TadG